jgi:hypothetical protein
MAEDRGRMEQARRRRRYLIKKIFAVMIHSPHGVRQSEWEIGDYD